MLGMVNRTVLGLGPIHFQQFFRVNEKSSRLHKRRHAIHLLEARNGQHLDILARSAIRLITVYNLLPQLVVEERTVSRFQSALTKIIRYRLDAGRLDWAVTLTPRVPLYAHPLLHV